jgi:hypothetical protein
MALWLLEAKSYPDETRSPAAKEARHLLKPGTYKVGRKAGEVDIVIQEDNSISRQHAVIIVPALREIAGGEAPYVVLKGTAAALRCNCSTALLSWLCWARARLARGARFSTRKRRCSS